MDQLGPTAPQAFLLARCQALRRIGHDVVPTDEGDVVSQKPSREEERIMTFNLSVVAALEDIFSWMNKDRNARTSQLSFVESWRFRRAMYRAWTMSTLYGYESAPRGQLAQGTSIDTQKAFLSKYTSQELIQINKVCRFLRSLAGWAVLAECQLVGSLDVYDFDSLYLFAGPHIILRCFEEQSSKPLPLGYDDEIYEDFLLPPLEAILSRRNVTIPLGFVGSILDDVRGVNDTCRGCGRNGWPVLPSARFTANLYNENNWVLLKGYLGTPSELFLKLASNQLEKPLFKILRETNFDVLVDELFAHKGEPYLDWARQDWVCSECFREFFIQTVFRWWRVCRRVDHTAIAALPGSVAQRFGDPVVQDCRHVPHGYFCRDQCFDGGLEHARRFNHACMPVDEVASLAHYHGR